ncbi:hypothetical protein LRS11_20575 [Pseudomonas sp. J452]|uniref:hypothetical protein n=1 Tax=Pseudomonas sp. J452 TaxID=2898441 RepID=UPI0021AD8B7B|nr:hypothetical protein [Pseudomonas sp. J452]UUY08165.1 hypothetical protein LRS11_20575 [Pseudomonas sp. J452]
MLLLIEYLILFGPALMFAGIGIAILPLGLLMGGHGMFISGISIIVLIELFSLLGLYGCFQLLRKRLDPTISVAKPAALLIQVLLGGVAVIAFGLMGAFYEIGWHLYILGAPVIGALHLIYLNREYLFGNHS